MDLSGMHSSYHEQVLHTGAGHRYPWAFRVHSTAPPVIISKILAPSHLTILLALQMAARGARRTPASKVATLLPYQAICTDANAGLRAPCTMTS
jgi:hypothetical protein